MSGSVIHSQSAAMVPAVYSAGQSPQLPVVIDYPAALALRQMSMVHDELPKYLLAPEVSALLHYVRICAARCCWPNSVCHFTSVRIYQQENPLVKPHSPAKSSQPVAQ